MTAALFLHFKKPVMIVEGKMQYLYDEHGRRYLDVSPPCTAPPLTGVEMLPLPPGGHGVQQMEASAGWER